MDESDRIPTLRMDVAFGRTLGVCRTPTTAGKEVVVLLIESPAVQPMAFALLDRADVKRIIQEINWQADKAFGPEH